MSWARDTCWACVVGLPEECYNPQQTDVPGWIVPCGALTGEAVRQGPSTRVLDLADFTDDTSAGRKRAALVAPILNGMECEWSNLKFAGGGVVPIVGCTGNRLGAAKTNEEARALGGDEVGHDHHGPDKSVMNNAPGTNLHRICTTCHNRWHAVNDIYYETPRPHPSRPWTPREAWLDHDTVTIATPDDRKASDAWWATKKDERPEYPLRSEGRRHSPASAATLDDTTNPFE